MHGVEWVPIEIIWSILPTYPVAGERSSGDSRFSSYDHPTPWEKKKEKVTSYTISRRVVDSANTLQGSFYIAIASRLSNFRASTPPFSFQIAWSSPAGAGTISR